MEGIQKKKAIWTLSSLTVESYHGGHTEEEGYSDVVKPCSLSNVGALLCCNQLQTYVDLCSLSLRRWPNIKSALLWLSWLGYFPAALQRKNLHSEKQNVARLNLDLTFYILVSTRVWMRLKYKQTIHLIICFDETSILYVCLAESLKYNDDKSPNSQFVFLLQMHSL